MLPPRLRPGAGRNPRSVAASDNLQMTEATRCRSAPYRCYRGDPPGLRSSMESPVRGFVEALLQPHTLIWRLTSGKVPAWTDSNKNEIDASSYRGACHVRDADSNFLLGFSKSGGSTINGAVGHVTLALPNTSTSTLDFDTGHYNLELTNSANLKSRLVQGTVTLST